MIRGLTAIEVITLFVEDLDATKDFYKSVFGLKAVYQDSASSVMNEPWITPIPCPNHTAPISTRITPIANRTRIQPPPESEILRCQIVERPTPDAHARPT